MAKNELQKRAEGKPSKNSLDLTKAGLSGLRKAVGGLEIPRLFYQLVVFVIDGSRSMNGATVNFSSKAVGVEDAIKRSLDRLKQSKNHSSFDVSLYVFSDDYKREFDAIPVAQISSGQTYNPLHLIGSPGDTFLADCLLDVRETVSGYLARNAEKNAQALILLLSDGAISDYSESLGVAQAMMADPKVTFASMYLERLIYDQADYYSWDEKTGQIDHDSSWTIEEVRKHDRAIGKKFKAFASSPDLSQSTLDPDEIRKHMVKSISMVSKI